MGSIVGEKWHNATSEDLAALDSEINLVQSQYDDFLLKYNTCVAGRTQNAFYSCQNNTGFTKTSIENHLRDLKNELTSLTARREALSQNIQSTLQAGTLEATNIQETAKAASEAGSATGKWVLVIGGIVLLIGGSIFFLRKIKK